MALPLESKGHCFPGFCTKLCRGLVVKHNKYHHFSLLSLVTAKLRYINPKSEMSSWITTKLRYINSKSKMNSWIHHRDVVYRTS